MPDLPSLLPGLVISLLFLAGWFLKPLLRRSWLALTLPALCCACLDALLLHLLPVLRLSFGPPGVPLFLFTLTRLVLLLPGLVLILLQRKTHTPKAALPVLAAAMQVILSLLAMDGLYIEPFRLTLSRLQPASPDLLTNRPVRILHLTDLHLEHPTRREQEVLAQVETLQPDLIVLTGDYLNPTYLDDPISQAEVRQFLAQLQAPCGVFAVNGTVDDPLHMSILFAGLENIRVLDDEMAVLPFPGGTLALLGVSNTSSQAQDVYTLQMLAQQVPAGAYSLLLYHTPDLMPEAALAGIDLYLAGHTHGGQVRLPFYGALVTFSAYGKRYEMGAYQQGDTTLYVSRGLGMEGWDAPRLRFLCPPEMLLVELGTPAAFLEH